MKKNKYIGMMLMAAGLFAATSCSDYDDYNKAVADVTPSANQTLWENIQQNSQLSDFASLLQKAGFDDELNTTHYYTVWAPLNGTFDAAKYQAMGNGALLRQFVKNHIADYGHNATGALNERVMMLNEKAYDFVGSSAYTFDNVQISQANLPSSNGILHTINGVAAYYPNLYEYIMDADLSKEQGIDSLRNYFKRYETTYLDEKASVPGPIVNGMQTYVDSVMITENLLWNRLNAKLYDEDSTYTFLMPTNETWETQYEKVKSFYSYIPQTSAQLFVTSGGSTSINKTPATINIDAAFWNDSLTNWTLTRNLVYSNNDVYNRWIEGTPTSIGSDTLRTSVRNKLSNPQAILSPTIEKVPMSNGYARIINAYGMYSWETYAPERIVSAASADNRAMISNGSFSRVEVRNPDPEKVTLEEGENSIRYAWVEPTGGGQFVKPEMTLYLRNVLSTTYEIYCVFVPESVDPDKANAVTLPNRVIFTLNYCDVDGKLKDYTFLNEDPDQMAAFMERFNMKDNATNKNTIRSFSNDTSKVDTLYIGEFTFPVCYYGLGDEYCPNIKITTPYSVFNASLREAYSRDLRIAGIILRPKELAEFEESNK